MNLSMPRKLKLPKGFPPELAIKIVRKRNFRHLRLRFDCNATLIVNLPKYISQKTCEEFIETNLQWILECFEKSQQAQEELRENQFHLFGRCFLFLCFLFMFYQVRTYTPNHNCY